MIDVAFHQSDEAQKAEYNYVNQAGFEGPRA